MPPFRAGPIEVDRRFDGETLRELRDIGHGHRINIVDASYDIPRGAKVVNFPGSSADALVSVFRLIPVEGDMVTIMGADHIFGPEQAEKALSKETRELLTSAYGLFDRALDVILKEVIKEGEINDLAIIPRDGEHGFYEIANNPDQASLFIRTIDELPFACATLLAGHSQRT